MSEWNALWHGGRCFAQPSVPEDTETFETLAEAREEFRLRAEGMARIHPVDAPRGHYEYVHTPAVGVDAEMKLWKGDPEAFPESGVALRFGPRRGVYRSRF